MQWLNLAAMLIVAWCVMTFTHEMGHLLGGWCGGGTLKQADLLPWHLPYSIFQPDPHPLLTLWSGPILGIVLPMTVGCLIRKPATQFIAYFCVLANGAYIATAWLTGDRFLDTTKLLVHGASPISLATYCVITIGVGYMGFRDACKTLVAGNIPKGGEHADTVAVDVASETVSEDEIVKR